MKYLQITFILFLTLLIIYPVLSQNNAVYTVQLNTIVHDNPPSIHFFWDENLNTENYQIYKRDKNSTEWGQPIATLEGNATQFTDFNIEPGEVFEYGFFKTPSWIMDTALVAPGTHLTFTINDSWGDAVIIRCLLMTVFLFQEVIFISLNQLVLVFPQIILQIQWW